MKMNEFPFDLGERARFYYKGETVEGTVSDLIGIDETDNEMEYVVVRLDNGAFFQYFFDFVSL